MHRVNAHYDKYAHPQQYDEGYLVLLYDQSSELLGAGNFNPMWHGPYMVRHVPDKGAYDLEYYEGNVLKDPKKGLYLKKYYDWVSNLGWYLVY